VAAFLVAAWLSFFGIRAAIARYGADGESSQRTWNWNCDWAVADDGVVKAIRHSTQPIVGIMWHPERFAPLSSADVALFRQLFAVERCAQ
jgi:anthranilate/para-aminobenzoate synthase component II